AEAELERAALERQPPDVRNDGPETGDSRLREIDPYNLARAECDEAGEIRGLGERVADVEHRRLAVVAGEAPRDLDRALVAAGGRRQAARPRRARDRPRRSSRARGRRDRVVEEPHALELLARGE